MCPHVELRTRRASSSRSRFMTYKDAKFWLRSHFARVAATTFRKACFHGHGAQRSARGLGLGGGAAGGPSGRPETDFGLH